MCPGFIVHSSLFSCFPKFFFENKKFVNLESFNDLKLNFQPWLVLNYEIY